MKRNTSNKFGFGGRGPPEQKQEHTDHSGLYASVFQLGPKPASTGPAPINPSHMQGGPNLGGSNLESRDEINRRLAAALAAAQQSKQQAEAERAQEVAQERAREAPLQNAPRGAAGRGSGRGKRKMPDQKVPVVQPIAPTPPPINRADMSRMEQELAERNESEFWRHERNMVEDNMPRDMMLRNRMALFPMHPDFERWKQELAEYEPVSSPWEVDDLVNQWTNNDAHSNDTVAYTSNHP